MDFIPLNRKKRPHTLEKHPKKKLRSCAVANDPKLVARLKTHIQENPQQCYDIDQVADDLQQRYREYQRKKRNSFKFAVTKAHEYLLENGCITKGPSVESDSVSSGDSFYSDFSVEDEIHSKYNQHNVVNKSLQDLYATPMTSNVEKKKKLKKLKKSNQTLENQPDKFESQLLNSETKKTDHFIKYSTVTFADVGACDKAVQDICDVVTHFNNAEVYAEFNLNASTGILLHGPPGSGKTLLADAVAGELQIPFFKLAATELVSGVSGESEEQIRHLFARAATQAPCIIFIDEIDAIGMKKENTQKEMEKRIVTQLTTCMDDLIAKKEVQILVIGATCRPDSLDPSLRRAGRFDREICLGIPDENARLKILQVLCRKMRLHENCNLKQVARNSPGFVGADLKSLVGDAAMRAVKRILSPVENTENENEPIDGSIKHLNETEKAIFMIHQKFHFTDEQKKQFCIEMTDMEKALKVVQPSAKREGFATIPDVSWEDVGALKNIRKELEMCILAPIQKPEYFEEFGLSVAVAGILLCGPPGCGKTLIAKAIANETGVNFISVKGPELLNMYVGESERAVRQCFERARNSSPCIIFFDELDSLCPRRADSTENAASSRVVNQLLTEMDGIGDRKGVYIIGATNRADIIDPAVLRPGRLDKILYVGLPSTSDRVDILNTLTRKKNLSLAADVCLTKLAHDENCNGFSGADLAALVLEAGRIAVQDRISGLDIHEVCQKHFEAAVLKVKPSVFKQEARMSEKMRLRCSNLST